MNLTLTGWKVFGVQLYIFGEVMATNNVIMQEDDKSPALVILSSNSKR